MKIAKRDLNRMVREQCEKHNIAVPKASDIVLSKHGVMIDVFSEGGLPLTLVSSVARGVGVKPKNVNIEPAGDERLIVRMDFAA